MKRAPSASAAALAQRAALILERNRLGYTHGGDRRSWKFADKEWRHGREYLDKARVLQEKIAANASANGGDQGKRKLLPLAKTQEELAAEAQVGERTIYDGVKAHDAENGQEYLARNILIKLGHCRIKLLRMAATGSECNNCTLKKR